MSGVQRVCLECACNCSDATLGRRERKEMASLMEKEGSLVLGSFFKVMIGHQFSHLLFIPPKFARKVPALANETVHLEDSTGRQWEVTVSEHDGSYAFLNGWNSFSSDHGLEIGDFLIFFCLGSRFLVKIYDKTGCEKQELPKIKKRSRTTLAGVEKGRTTSESASHASRIKVSIDNQALSGSGSSIASGELSHCFAERNGVNKEAKDSGLLCPDAQPLPVKGYTEELLCVVDRVIRSTEEEEIRAAFDLSEFEMCKENIPGEMAQSFQGMSQSLGAPINLTKFEPEAGNAEIKETATICQGERSMSIQTEQLPVSGGLIQPMHLQMSADTNDTSGAFTEEIGEEPKEDVKERINCVEQAGTTSNSDASAQRYHSSSSVPDRSCTVRITAFNRNTLKLPGNLPATFFRGGKNKDRRMLFLQDPMRRLWPIVYLDRGDSRFLSHGWEGFRSAHNLKPGDNCIFEVRDEAKALFGVSIVQQVSEACT
ncbi:hypothetical protein MLD38_021903 [Melastoma candidum]|uniref:Uncharacterized protein n=1 Tax=Melastoma candidum TaxID=119954 RepID=A0ACB9QHR8_9MYRT|nr:hypothetical protein MLD38_021903 [Melastoma candidum]